MWGEAAAAAAPQGRGAPEGEPRLCDFIREGKPGELIVALQKKKGMEGSRRVPGGGGGGAAGPAGRAPADPRGRAVSRFAGFPLARRGCGAGGVAGFGLPVSACRWGNFYSPVTFGCGRGTPTAWRGLGAGAWWGWGRVVSDRKKRWKRRSK